MSSLGISTLGSTLDKIATVLGSLATMVFPGSATVASAVKIAVAVGQGLEAAVPAAQALYDEITGHAGDPTAEQWAQWDAAADKASADLDVAASAALKP